MNVTNIIQKNSAYYKDQIKMYRKSQRNQYRDLKNPITSIIQNVGNTHKSPPNTILIAADSMLNSIDSKKISKNINVIGRAFPGASVISMSYLQPILNKDPTHIILHVGTND